MNSPSGIAVKVVEAAARRGLSIATGESLTAGQVAAALADVPGSSRVLWGGIVSYRNAAKSALLGVDVSLLAVNGSVDPAVAAAMAAGARRALEADVGLATTGVAGPAPHDGKPVGTVYIGIDSPFGAHVHKYLFSGDRSAVRDQTCAAALQLLLDHLTGSGEQTSGPKGYPDVSR